MKRLIIIDNGHGYDTKGKRALMPNGEMFLEWEFNRILKLKLLSKLYKIGLPFYELVPESYDVSLQQRVSRANEVYNEEKNKNPYLLSLHGNAFTSSKANGISVFTSKGVTSSDYIANIYVEELAKLGLTNRYDINSSNLKGKEEDFYILRKTKCPAILTELGFYTNKKDVLKMNDSFFQEKIVDSLIRAIIRVNHEM